MAKKKAEPKPESARKPMVVQIRGSEDYKAWAEEFAASRGDTLAKLYDWAARQLAKQEGFREPPKR